MQKEYIEKQKIEKLLDRENIYQDVINDRYDMLEKVRELPTVTQTDFEQNAYERGYRDGQDKGMSDERYCTAREFAKKLKEKLYRIDDSASLSARDVVDEEDIDELIEELEI